MPVTTKSVELEQDTQDSAFAKQLEAMLGGLPSHNANAAPQTIERNIAIDQVSIDEVLAQANDGISLAQIIDATMQQAGDLLAQLYYSIEDTAAAGPTNYIALNNSIRQQIDAIDTLFASVTFQDQAIFDTPSQRKVPTGLNKDDFVTLQIPNVSLNQLGAKSWQLADGPILPRRVDEQLVFRFNNLRLQDSQRVRLLIGEADVLQECMGDLNSTMATIAELINQAELDWLNQAIVDNGELSVNAPGVTTANLLV